MFCSKRLFIVFVLAFLLVFVTCQADSFDRKILIVGDSLSAGYGIAENESWVTLFKNRLSASGYDYEVINASISGDTTGGGLRRLPRALEAHGPTIVLIELGGNDGLRGTPVIVVRKNLTAMIERSQAAGAEVVLAGMMMPPNYGQAYTDAFAGMYRELADEHDTALIEFFMKNVALNPALMQADQIHPNAAGQPYLLDNAWEILEPLLQ
jgi:acyl-CoA thioesterase-1